MTAFSLNEIESGVFSLTFDCKDLKVNTLSTPVLEEFKRIISELKLRSDIRALLIKSGKPGVFIAGADINEIKDIYDKETAKDKVQQGQDILNQIESLPFPTIAAIQGVCMGGGTELALACTYRVASDHAKVTIALPEVNLGIIPGFGGTQRLPRLIGLQQSLPLILTGKGVNGKKAEKIRLVDAYFSDALFDQNLLKFVKQILVKPEQVTSKRKRKGLLNAVLEHTFLGRSIVYSQARKTVLKKSKGFYPAPLAALDAVKKGLRKPLLTGLEIERDFFAEVCITDISKQLISLFFLMEAAKKYRGIDDETVAALTISRAAVLGAGLMGGGISWILAYSKIPTLMKDIDNNALTLGYNAADKMTKALLKRRKLTSAEAMLLQHRLQGTLSLNGFKYTDIVIEAIVENMDIKKKVLADVEGQVSPNTILATNTSSLSVTEMATSLKRPEKFLGLHFFSPVNRMPLVEVIPGEKTSPETILSVVNLAKKLKKTPIVVQNCPGFLVNRILIPYVNEAVRCVMDGASIEQVDKVAEKFGMPLGPLALADEVGLDIGFKVSKILEEGYGERMALPALFNDLSKHDNMKGKKSGQGFYNYSNKEKVVNQSMITMINSSHNKLSETEIQDRLILIMVNEAARCIEEGVVENAGLLDLAMILGTGFPPFRGGLCRYADSLGSDQLYERMDRLQQRYGCRFEVAPLIKQFKKDQLAFY